MSLDLRWMSNGGVLVDGSGDLAFTDDPMEAIRGVVQSRIKAAFDGWKIYQIGADLGRVVGETVSQETEIKIQRQVQAALTKNFLPAGTFDVKTVPGVGNIMLYVYLNETLLTSAQVNL
jgi:hypothetical protein